MTTTLFGFVTALLVAVAGVGWYRQQHEPRPARRSRRAAAPIAAPPTEAVVSQPLVSREAAERLVPLTPPVEAEDVAEPFYGQTAEPKKPSVPLATPRPIPSPTAPTIAALTPDERLGELPPSAPLPQMPMTRPPRPRREAKPVLPPRTEPSAYTIADDEWGDLPRPAAAPSRETIAPTPPSAPPPPVPTPSATSPEPPTERVATNEAIDADAAVVGYCARCQEKRPVRDVIRTTTRKGRPALRGHCAVCGAGMYIFVADESQ